MACFGSGEFVGGHGEAALDDVENAFRGAAVAAGVMQNSLGSAVGVQVRETKLTAPGGRDISRASPGRSSTKACAGNCGAPAGQTSFR